MARPFAPEETEARLREEVERFKNSFAVHEEQGLVAAS